jgi:hypothetical protein
MAMDGQDDDKGWSNVVPVRMGLSPFFFKGAWEFG